MPDREPFTRESPSFWFGAAGLWAVVIFLTVPYAPKITGTITAWINDRFAIDWGYALIGHAAVGLLVAVLAWAGWRQRRHGAWRSPWRLLVVLVTLGAYAFILPRMEIAAEKLHFLQYGLLAWLFWRGWRLVVASPAVWALSFFSGSFVGVLDEGLQYVTPGRHGESVDMLWNILAAGLPLLLLAAFAERSREPCPSPRDRRLLRATGLAFFLPLFGFLFFAQEYGTRIDDPRGYIFRTRLASVEALRHPPVLTASVLEELKRETPFSYSGFLARHPEKTEPHLNEFRVHLYRRDRYLGQAAHARLRRLAAGVVSETSTNEGRAIESALEQPVSKRALRSYAALYMGDWLRDRYGADLATESGSLPLRTWIDGTETSWGVALWDSYRTEHARKASREGAPSTEKIAGDLRIAWNEHRILSDWFPEYTTASGSDWPAGLEDAVWSAVRARVNDHGTSSLYESAVAERVLDRRTRGFAIFVAILLTGILLLFPRAYATHKGALLLLVIVSQGWFGVYLTTRVAERDVDRLAPSFPEVTLANRSIRSGPAVDADAPLTLSGANGETDVLQTLVYLDSTPDAFWIAFRVRDSDIVARQTERDGELWRDDAVEVFIDTEGTGRRYVEVQVNPAGVVSDALIEWSLAIDFAAAARWNAPGIQAVTTRDSEGWTAEILLPWAALGMPSPPPPGSVLRANFCRVDRDRAEPPVYTYQAWSPTRGWFHRPLRFGKVGFSS